MVKGGCTCELFKEAVRCREIYLMAGKTWVLNFTNTVYAFNYCPWCSSPLTPPEEDGDATEAQNDNA